MKGIARIMCVGLAVAAAACDREDYGERGRVQPATYTSAMDRFDVLNERLAMEINEGRWDAAEETADEMEDLVDRMPDLAEQDRMSDESQARIDRNCEELKRNLEDVARNAKAQLRDEAARAQRNMTQLMLDLRAWLDKQLQSK